MTGTPVAGDAFLLSATGRAAGSMKSLVQNPEKLALAGQLATSSDIGNLGDTVISPVTITNPEDTELTTPIDIIFTSDTTYDIVDLDSGTVLVDEADYLPNEAIALNGFEISISGDAKAGDTHSITPNVSGRGDNSNGLALTDMQTELLVIGKESFNDAYGSLVSSIGSNTNAAATRTTALEALRDNAIDRQQTAQGVSLDEEAIDLTRYQQAYQAAAQIISTSETLVSIHTGSRSMINGRVPSNLLASRIANDIVQQQNSLADIQEQISSGKKVNRPSDAPAQAAHLLTMRETTSRLEQYSENSSIAESQLSP